MSEITIVYKELEDAADKAKEIAGACEEYEDELQSKICNKISGVAPSPMPAGNSRLSSANMYVRNKKSQLREKGRNYKEFAKKCNNLARNAQNADRRVGVEVNNSRENFLKDHPELKGDGWDAFFAGLIANVPGIGWIADWAGDVKDKKRDIKNNIRKWYEIDGGKKIVDTTLAVVGLVVAAVAVAAAGVAAVAAIGAIGAAATVGAAVGAVVTAVVEVVGLVGAVIGYVNATTNLTTQIEADTCEDPAFANFYGNQNDLPTVLRKKTFRGEYKNWNNASMKWADNLETAEFVCDMVGIGAGAYDMFKSSGVRDMCGKMVKGKDGDDIFKYDWNQTKKKFGTIEGWKEAGESVKKNLPKIVLGDDGFEGTAKTFEKAGKIKKVTTIKELDTYTKAVKKTGKLVQAGFKTGESRLKGYLYNEYDIKGEVDTFVEITGVKGAVDVVNEVYDVVKDAVS